MRGRQKAKNKVEAAAPAVAHVRSLSMYVRYCSTFVRCYTHIHTGTSKVDE